MTLNSIVANFQTFKLVDLLDILIIAFLIYQLLGFVNRTRAGQLAKGALIVMAVYLVANILNMRTVTWLLNSLLQVGLLTLVVLFQPEIRRALERMGQTDQWAYRFFNKNRYNDTSLKGAWRSAIIAICDAAERFSETKTGALIVLGNNQKVQQVSSGGFKIGIECTEQALRELRVVWKPWPGMPELGDTAEAIRANPATARRLIDDGQVDAVADAPSHAEEHIAEFGAHFSAVGELCQRCELGVGDSGSLDGLHH